MVHSTRPTSIEARWIVGNVHCTDRVGELVKHDADRQTAFCAHDTSSSTRLEVGVWAERPVPNGGFVSLTAATHARSVSRVKRRRSTR